MSRNRSPVSNTDASDLKAIFELCGFDALGDDLGASAVEDSLRALVDRLHGADKLRLGVARAEATKRLEAAGVKLPQKVVDAGFSHAGLQGAAVRLEDPEPWPDEVKGDQVLDEIVAVLNQHLVLPPGASEALALWIVMTYVLDELDVAPYLGITSPTKRCGKTKLINLLLALVRRGLSASNITSAALFRTIAEYQPTLLIDEADTFLDRNEEMRGILNAGHTRSTAIVIRTVGDDHEPRQFLVWCGKAIARIGKLPGTVADRSILIRMRRRRKDEVVQRFRHDQIRSKLLPIRRRIARWAKAWLLDLMRVFDDGIGVPEELDDRAQDNWRPLLVIAELAEEGWPERARRAALTLSGREPGDTDTLGVQLLSDLRALVEERQQKSLLTEAILDGLKQMPERPWCEHGNGQGLSARQLGSLLSPFGVHSRNVRVGNQVQKGYLRADLEDAFARYVPDTPLQALQPCNSNDLRQDNGPLPASDVAGQPSPVTDCKHKQVADVAAAGSKIRRGISTRPCD